MDQKSLNHFFLFLTTWFDFWNRDWTFQTSDSDYYELLNKFFQKAKKFILKKNQILTSYFKVLINKSKS